MTKCPELLAPAGSRESLVAAVANGADAVYLGGTLFNARQTASNFDNQALSDAVRFAHRSGVKVYVTVNTLLKDSELPEAVRFLQFLYNIGADAAIVQDPGLITAAREYVPDLELHASTQLTIHNHQGVNALEELGIERVVLARELSVQQIAHIAGKSRIGLEIFVHGALCVAYSGQCLFSSMAGGRSGNRGMCAQPCRLPYQLQPDERAGHLLSPKDICLLPHLQQLLRLDVDAWKIEGRLKRPSYVAATVRHYREVRDALMAGKDPAEPEWRLREMSQAFNRGYSTGYVLQRPGTSLLTEQGPGHQGAVVGTTLANGQVLLSTDLASGDLLLGPDGNEYTVGQAHAAGRAMLGALRYKPGQQVVRLRSQAQERAAAEQIQEYAPPDTILDIQATLRSDAPLQLIGTASGREVTITGTRLPERARSVEVSSGMLERQLSKLGGSGFALGELTAEVEPGLSLPVSEINQCRRAVTEQLSELLWGQPFPLEQMPSLISPGGSKHSRQTGWSVAVSSLDAVQVALKQPFERIYFGSSWYSHSIAAIMSEYELARKACGLKGVSCYLRLPRIMLPEEADCWAAALRQHHLHGLLVANFGAVKLAQDIGVPFVLDSSMNIVNTWALHSVKGAEAGVLSPELNQGEVRQLLQDAASTAILTVHARHLLMIHEQCLIHANASCSRGEGGCPAVVRQLQDRKGYKFPVLSDSTCRSYVYNSQVFSLVDQIGPLVHQGAYELLIDGEMDDASTLERVLPLYISSRDQAGRSERQREALAAIYAGNLTRGHWRRGV